MRSYLSSFIFWIYHFFKTKNRIKFFSRIENTELGGLNLIESDCDLKNLYLGKASYISKKVYIRNCIIGNFCSIGPNVLIGLGEHPIKFVSTHPAFYTYQRQLPISFNRLSNFNEYSKTLIGNDVWIGANVIIKAGIKIGDGSIIAAGSVVTKDVDCYTIIGGVPAKAIKNRFENHIVEKLKNIKWWNWDIEKIRVKSQEFLEPNSFLTSEEPKE